MAERAADMTTCAHGAQWAGWLTRTLVMVAVSALPWQGYAQDTPEWKRLHAEVEKLYDEGRYADAIPLAERAALLAEEALDDYHPELAERLNNLAVLYSEQGRYGEAEPLLKRALSIRKQALGPHHPDVAESMYDLAGLYESQGRYGEVEPLLKHALDIFEKTLGGHHPYVAVCLSALAILYEIQGRYGEAEPLYQRILDIFEKAPEDHRVDVAACLNNLAGLYGKQERYREAEPLFQRALGIFEKALGPDHPHVAASLNNLAWLHERQGQYVEAEPLYHRALSIREKALGAHHPRVATSLNNLAWLYEKQGQYVEAEPLYHRALSIREKALGAHHPDVAESLKNLAGLHLAQNDVDRAINYAERAERASDELLSAMMRGGSEHQRHAFMAKHIHDVDIGVTLAVRAPGNSRAQSLAMRHLLRRKGRVLDAMRSILSAARDNLDEEGQALLDRYLSIRSEYAMQYLRGPHAFQPDEHQKNLAELEKQKRDIEARLSEKSAQFAEAHRPVTLSDVQNALTDEGAVLVEWIRYDPWDPSKRTQDALWQSARYAACVLARRGTPTCLDLGDAQTIDAAALAFHRAVALGLESRAPTRTLEALIMAPVRRVLGEARTLYLSPDGALQLIPFAALLHQENRGPERYLMEEFELVHVTSGRELVRTPRAGFAPGPVTVLGDPRYSAPGAASDNRFPRLFGTRLEAEELGALLPGARLLVGADAVESTVKQARAPWILHLATHAYFGARDCAGNTHATDNPLLAAGLLLAGANACDDGSGGDGILTGEELAGLNLYGTQLVVLSACDTGIGALALSDEQRLIGNRDGVYGLRRALMLAGAETQVVSLWKVNDVATRELMGAYYQELLAGRGRAEALRRVQLTMLQSKERAHPYYWASFAVVGMKDPLRLPAGMKQPALTRGPRGCACEVAAGSSAQGREAMLVLALALSIMVVIRARCRAAVALVLAAMLAVVMLAACGGSRPPAKAKPQPSDEAVAHLVLDWTIGPTRAPPPTGRARLLWRTSDQALDHARPVTICEENTQSILPTPDGKRVYLAAGGAIFFVPSAGLGAGPGAEAQLTPLAMSPPGVRVRRLLAFARERTPFAILAHVEEGATARETLWLFRVQGQEAVGRRVSSYGDFADAGRFYRRFDNPRCQAGEQRCIVVSGYGEDSIVSVEGRRGSLPRAELKELSGVGVEDIAWAAGASQGAQWILHRCNR